MTILLTQVITSASNVQRALEETFSKVPPELVHAELITGEDGNGYRLDCWWDSATHVLDRHTVVKNPSIPLDVLALYDGSSHRTILVAIGETVFDVSESRAMYGKGQSYHFLAGRNATFSLAKGILDHVAPCELSAVEQMTVDQWLDKFESKYEVVATINEVMCGDSTVISKL